MLEFLDIMELKGRMRRLELIVDELLYKCDDEDLRYIRNRVKEKIEEEAGVQPKKESN